MKEFFNLLFHFKFRALFIDDTNNGFVQFFRFLFVGAAATVVDYAASFAIRAVLIGAGVDFGTAFGLDSAGITDLIASAGGFIFGLVANYFLSIIWVFKRDDINRVKEFTVFAIIGIVGLFINMGIMALLGNFLEQSTGWIFLLKKAIATLITLIWNFAGRKLILYRDTTGKTEK